MGYNLRFFSIRNGRTIFIGDVHGCLPELKEMIRRLKPRSSDRVILLGDLINRGPDSADVVRMVYDAGYECLMGNHEYEYLMRFRVEPKYRKLHEQLGDELHRWVEARPLYLETDDFIAVHAGMAPGMHPSRTPPEILLNIRTWDGSGGDLNNPENPPWYEFYREERPVIYGHWARRGLNIRTNTIGLDSGCVYGRRLSAYILEKRRLVQLQASRCYYVPPSLRGRLPASGS